MRKKQINLFEAFAGIGSQHQALLNLGINTNVVGISEWYIDALISYAKIHLKIEPKSINKDETIKFLNNFTFSRDSKNPLKSYAGLSDEKLSIIEQVVKMFGELDINKISGEQLINKDIDIFTYSFPCTDLSNQGKQKGMKKELDEDKKTRSGLLWEIERILLEMKNIDKTKLPKVLLMENVKSLISAKFRPDLDEWIKSLDSLGYVTVEPFVLNPKEFGYTQNRDRVFMISILKSELNKNNFKFGLFENFDINLLKEKYHIGKELYIKDIFEKDLEHDILNLNNNIEIIHNINKKENSIKKGMLEGYSTFNSEKGFYYQDGKSPTITSTGALSKIKVYDKENDKIIILNGKEHLNLQGFQGKYYDIMKGIGLSDNKIKFLAGNSIHVKILEIIFNKILN